MPAPSDGDVAEVAARVFRRVSRIFDELADDVAAAREPLLARMSAASLRRMVATGPRRGRPIRRLGHDRLPQARILGKRCAEVEGFNVHANVCIAANDRAGLEGLCRYVARPPLSADRLAELPDGTLALRLKRPVPTPSTATPDLPTTYQSPLGPPSSLPLPPDYNNRTFLLGVDTRRGGISGLNCLSTGELVSWHYQDREGVRRAVSEVKGRSLEVLEEVRKAA